MDLIRSTVVVAFALIMTGAPLAHAQLQSDKQGSDGNAKNERPCVDSSTQCSPPGVQAKAANADPSANSSSLPQNPVPELTKSFHTRSAWRLVVTQGAPIKNDDYIDAPGALSLCLQRNSADTCVFDLATPAAATSPDEPNEWEPHYLLKDEIVYPKGSSAPPLLMLVTASLYSGNGNQLVTTQLFRYDAGHDEFQRVFSQSTGHNNNEEVRFVTNGPIRGNVISAVPLPRRPYGYEIVVNALSSAEMYREVLRFHSATTYGDGNHLAVIDSEMPNIQRRLGFWKPGQPLPAPAMIDGRPCDKPVLKHTELWCD